uniref:Uncharacterized protein n=1 Tax=Tetranychus urticae TaxID=32264 RepID=T1KE81_TETUR
MSHSCVIIQIGVSTYSHSAFVHYVCMQIDL